MSIIMNRSEWEDFVYRLNNSTSENAEARKRFFEECSKLIINSKDDRSFIVQCPDLNEEKILASLNA